jgi:hypothetical protein
MSDQAQARISEEAQGSEGHATHDLEHESHWHGEACGHMAVQHEDHMDYEHDGHRHAQHEGHYDEHGKPETGYGPSGD